MESNNNINNNQSQLNTNNNYLYNNINNNGINNTQKGIENNGNNYVNGGKGGNPINNNYYNNNIMDIHEKEAKLNYGGEMSYRGEYNGSYRSPYTTYSNDWHNGNYNSYNYGRNNNLYDSSYSRHTATEQMIEKLETMKQDATVQNKAVIQRCIDELKNQ